MLDPPPPPPPKKKKKQSPWKKATFLWKPLKMGQNSTTFLDHGLKSPLICPANQTELMLAREFILGFYCGLLAYSVHTSG